MVVVAIIPPVDFGLENAIDRYAGIVNTPQEFPALGSGMANLNLGGNDEGYSRQVRVSGKPESVFVVVVLWPLELCLRLTKLVCCSFFFG